MSASYSEIKKLFEKVFETYNNSKIKNFYKPAGSWYPETPLLLSKLDKETAQKLLNLIKPLQNSSKQEIIKAFSSYGVVLPKEYQEKDVEDRDNYLTFRNDNSIGHKSEHFLKVIQELEEISGEERNENHDNGKCSKCQGEFTKKDGKLVRWIPKGKEKTYLCCACKDKEQQYSGIPSTMKDMTMSDPGMEGGVFYFCGLCNESVKEKEAHEKDGDRRIIKHECFPKCEWVCKKKFQLTQNYSDLLYKYKLDRFCFDCQEKRLKQLVKINHETNKNKEALKELEKLTGRGNNNDNRERAFWNISSSTISNQLLYKVINF